MPSTHMGGTANAAGGAMASMPQDENTRAHFVESLTSFTQQHRAKRWEGTFRQFVEDVLADHADQVARTSHEYVWDMLRWYAGREEQEGEEATPYALFSRELYGIDAALERVVEYFKSASAGSEVGRRLLLLL